MVQNLNFVLERVENIEKDGWLVGSIGVYRHFIGSPSHLGTYIYQNTEKSSLYSQSLLIFIHKTPVVKSHPTTREIKDFIWRRSTPTGNTVYF